MKPLLTLVLMLSATAGATHYPLTLKDDLGRQVTLKAEPKRVISMLPSNTETVCALGACDRLVGVDKYSSYPAQVVKWQTVGDAFNPNLEAMLALKPDLVLVSKYGKLPDSLMQAGVTVISVSPESYDDVFTKTLLLGRILNREAQAKALVTTLKREMARVEILTKNATHKPLTYFEVDPAPYSVGPNSFMGVLLGKAGARNIIPASMGDFPKVDPEFIVKANPELVLSADLTLKEAAARPGWSGLTAVKTGKVVTIPSDLNTILTIPGPRLAQAFLGLAKLVHPELFK